MAPPWELCSAQDGTASQLLLQVSPARGALQTHMSAHLLRQLLVHGCISISKGVVIICLSRRPQACLLGKWLPLWLTGSCSSSLLPSLAALHRGIINLHWNCSIPLGQYNSDRVLDECLGWCSPC